jgi:hypothetical protein
MSCYFKDLIHFEKGIIVPQISFENLIALLEWTFLSMKNISTTTGITLNWKHPKNHCCGTRM